MYMYIVGRHSWIIVQPLSNKKLVQKEQISHGTATRFNHFNKLSCQLPTWFFGRCLPSLSTLFRKEFWTFLNNFIVFLVRFPCFKNGRTAEAQWLSELQQHANQAKYHQKAELEAAYLWSLWSVRYWNPLWCLGQPFYPPVSFSMAGWKIPYHP